MWGGGGTKIANKWGRVKDCAYVFHPGRWMQGVLPRWHVWLVCTLRTLPYTLVARGWSRRNARLHVPSLHGIVRVRVRPRTHVVVVVAVVVVVV